MITSNYKNLSESISFDESINQELNEVLVKGYEYVIVDDIITYYKELHKNDKYDFTTDMISKDLKSTYGINLPGNFLWTLDKDSSGGSYRDKMDKYRKELSKWIMRKKMFNTKKELIGNQGMSESTNTTDKSTKNLPCGKEITEGFECSDDTCDHLNECSSYKKKKK